MGSARPSAPDGALRRLEGLVRIVHPFPSLLDGAVTAALVLIAGGSGLVAARLGIAMVALQFAIGTANDLADEVRDRGRKTGKPLPRGMIARREAWLLFAVLLAVGLVLSAASGPAVFAVALAGTLVGLAYDAFVKGTVWSWLPFALGLPLLPVYAWLGAADRLPPSFALLLPTAVLAGAGLALANLLADLDRDAASGTDTLATRLGPRRTWGLGATALGGVIAIALLSLVPRQGRGPGVVGVALGIAVAVAGLALGRRAAAVSRERGWELQAAGIGLIAAGWVAALAEAGAL